MKCEAGAGGDCCTKPECLLHQLHELGDAELLGVLLAGGRVRPEAVRLARELLAGWGGLAAFPGASRAMLRSCGLRDAQASALLVTGEIACRLARLRVSDQEPLSSPDDLARFLALRYHRRDQEVMGALFLSSRRRLLGDQEIYRGTMHRATVEPREILKECLLRRARFFVLFHTHPSGDPTPSVEDLAFTGRMALASRLVGVEMLDHLVLGAMGQWVSLEAWGGW
jgi:DNA repair protein RadC